MKWLKRGALNLGIDLTHEQERQFRQYRQELVEWNRRVNLTAITNPDDIERLHFLDSLTVALAVPEIGNTHLSLCDVGTGAGFPGMPLRIAFPSMTLALVDSSQKRTRFLEHLVAELGLDGVVVHRARAESVGRDPDLRESFDVVVARAVAELRVLLEVALPLCKIGGRAVLQKKGDIQGELVAAAHACGELGGRLLEVTPVPEEVLSGQRVLVVVEKVAATPARYPRRAGVASKRPL